MEVFKEKEYKVEDKEVVVEEEEVKKEEEKEERKAEKKAEGEKKEKERKIEEKCEEEKEAEKKKEKEKEKENPFASLLADSDWSASEEKVISEIVGLIKTGKAKKIIVMTGAGISTSAGIPDFRTPGTGLYDNLQKFDLPYAEAIFDIDYFEERPEPFFELASELYPGVKYLPTWSHQLIKLLEKKELLLRNFTQNIDGLEHTAGISTDLLVEAHGHFRTSTCLNCRFKTSTDKYKHLILNNLIPYCPKCQVGILKPDITFFGENLPTRFYEQMDRDFPECDLLLVMGTSLKVAPFSNLVNLVSPKVPTFLINLVNSYRSAPSSYLPVSYDRRFILAPCDVVSYDLARRLGWEEELVDLYTTNSLPPNLPVTTPKTLEDQLDRLSLN